MRVFPGNPFIETLMSSPMSRGRVVQILSVSRALQRSSHIMERAPQPAPATWIMT